MRTPALPRRIVVLSLSAAFVASVAAGCGSAGGTAHPLAGTTIEVLAVWSGAEQQDFMRVVQAFENATGATVTYTPAGDTVPEVLSRRLAAGSPPDVAFLPQPGALKEYALAGRLIPLDDNAKSEVVRNFSPVWQALGSVDGQLYGVWFKAANKSLVWYNIGAFERAGVVPPDTLNGLTTVAHVLGRAGVPAFSVGGGSGWTLTDWFENLYLRMAGPERYDALAAHRLAWTDVTVRNTLRAMNDLLAPDLIAGGSLRGDGGALRVTYQQSVVQVFDEPPAAAMVFEGDFVASVIKSSTPAHLGLQADVFPFPPLSSGGAPYLVGGGDAAVLFRRSPAGSAFLRYLASPDAAAIWATQGGFVSPNLNVDLSVYPDELSRSIARGVLEAGDNFRFDLSDQAPAAFGGLEHQGMRGILQDFLTTRDVDGTASRLEAAAQAAYGS